MEKSKDYKVPTEALRISKEQNITFRQALDVAQKHKNALIKKEEKENQDV